MINWAKFAAIGVILMLGLTGCQSATPELTPEAASKPKWVSRVITGTVRPREGVKMPAGMALRVVAIGFEGETVGAYEVHNLQDWPVKFDIPVQWPADQKRVKSRYHVDVFARGYLNGQPTHLSAKPLFSSNDMDNGTKLELVLHPVME